MDTGVVVGISFGWLISVQQTKRIGAVALYHARNGLGEIEYFKAGIIPKNVLTGNWKHIAQKTKVLLVNVMVTVRNGNRKIDH